MADLYIGLMSGTSLDGADAVVAEFDDAKRAFPPTAAPRVLAHAHAAFAPGLREELLNLQRSGNDELHRAALAANALCDHYAQLVARLLSESKLDARAIAAIGAHGQTVRHRPELGYTSQLNAAARLAEATGIDVVADFRSRDIAAGGQGAPLVCAFHSSILSDPARHRAVVNLGGIANVTDLPPTSSNDAEVRGWDCGPANVLLDSWVGLHQGESFDAGGAWARSGSVVDALLAALKSEPWFALPPPKSTGRDLFGIEWLNRTIGSFSGLAAEDVQATLAELTAWAIADSLDRFVAATIDEVIVCGGGAHNADLLGRLSRQLEQKSGRRIELATTARYGVPVDQVEALAFAWLARRCKLRLPGNLPSVTGAKEPRILGALYPA